MKKKEIRRQKHRLKCLLQKWVEPLGMGAWRRALYFYYEDDVERFKGELGEVLFRTTASWPYEWIDIEVNVPLMVDIPDGELEEYFIHELMHGLLNEMRENDIKHEDRVCTNLARAFRWVRKYAVDRGTDEEAS